MPRSKLIALSLLLALAVGLRVYYLYFLYPIEKYVFSDMQIYLDNAKAILSGNYTSPIFSKPPFYEWLVALSLKLQEKNVFAKPLGFIQGLQFLLSLAIPLILWRAVQKWVGKKGALIVFACALFYFPFIAFSGLLMAEVPFAFFISLLILLILRSPFPWTLPTGILIGVLFGSALFFKGQIFFFPIIALPYSLLWWWVKKREDFKLKSTGILSAWAFFLAGSLCVYLSKNIVTTFVLHQPNKVPSVAAVNYTYARCDQCRRFVDSNGVWTCASKFHLVGGCDKECHFPASFNDSAFFWKQGNTCLKENPANILTSFSEVSALFVGNEAFPFMEIQELRMLNRNWELFFQLLILPGILFGCFWRFSWRGSLRVGIVLCMIPAIIVMAYVFTGDVRYRIPFDAVFLPLAIITWIKWSARFKSKAVSR